MYGAEIGIEQISLSQIITCAVIAGLLFGLVWLTRDFGPKERHY